MKLATLRVCTGQGKSGKSGKSGKVHYATGKSRNVRGINIVSGKIDKRASAALVSALLGTTPTHS